MRWLYMQKGIETQRKIDSRRQKSRAIMQILLHEQCTQSYSILVRSILSRIFCNCYKPKKKTFLFGRFLDYLIFDV